MKPVRKAVFPVAGFGTRFLPATKAMPKELLPIGSVDGVVLSYDFSEGYGIKRCPIPGGHPGSGGRGWIEVVSVVADRRLV